MDLRRAIITVPVLVSLLCVVGDAAAQNATVTLGSQKQYIRGFGGMSHAAWAGDMTAAERTLAFGNGDGQLGLTILRIPVTDGSPDPANVATAKAAIAAGAIVFATPWNSAGMMASSQFSSYADHLNGFVSYMKNQGVDLYAISVQNEPDYGTQAGWRAWTEALCHDFVLNYGATITTKLVSCESFSYKKSYYDLLLNDPAALANVAIMGTHLYGTALSGYPYPLFDQKGAGKERWMTEHYTDSTTDADSWPNALGVATEIHHAMVDAQFNAYVWWYIVRSYGPIKSPGTVSKRGSCMAQFSKFIRPGFYRVDATATPAAGVFLSAYKSATDVVIVAVNTTSSATSLNVSINGSTISSYDRFTTSASKSLANDGKVTATNGSLSLSLDPQSVTTLHGAGTTTGTGGSTGAAGAAGTGGAAGGRGSAGAGGSSGVAGSVGSGGSTSSGGSSGSAGGAGSGLSGASGSTGLAGAAGTTGAAGSGSTGLGGDGMGDRGGGPAGNDGATGAAGSTGAGEASTGGCTCGVKGHTSGSNAFTLVTLGLVALLSARRRRARSPRRR